MFCNFLSAIQVIFHQNFELEFWNAILKKLSQNVL